MISVQHYRSQFIKEGLKFKVQQKLCSTEGASGSFPLDSFDSSPECKEALLQQEIKQEELTEEDEIRRQRRRERNKVAATKCRNKKKAKTQMLIKVIFN